MCYLKVPCAALTRAHGDGTSLVQSSLSGGPQLPSLVLQQPSSPRKKSRITEVLGLNTALTESETSIRAIDLLTNLREKKKKSFPRMAVAQVRWAVELVLAAHVLS